MNCINKKSKEFIDLLEKTGLHHNVLEAKIINYQNKSGTFEFPKSDSGIFFQQLDLFNDSVSDGSNKRITVEEREAIKKEIENNTVRKTILKWDKKFNSFKVPHLREEMAREIMRNINKKYGKEVLKEKMIPIRKFSERNKGRTHFMTVRLMATDGTFPQIDVTKDIGIPDPELDNTMKGILADLGISLTNWEEYKKWYEKQYGKPLHAAGIADTLQKVIAINKDTAKLDTLPEEVAHFIIYAMMDVPWVQNLLNRVEESPEWTEHVDAYTKAYKGDMQKVRIEVLGKILAKGLVNEGQSLTPKWRRLISELWQRFLALFGRDDIRRRLDLLAAEIITDSSARRRLAANLDRFGITADDTGVFYSLDDTEFQGSDILEKHSNIVKKAVINLEDALRRDMNSKATAVERRKELYQNAVDLINRGNHTLPMASIIMNAENDGKQVLRRIRDFNRLFEDDSADINFNIFSKLLQVTKNYSSTYSDTMRELRVALSADKDDIEGEISLLEKLDADSLDDLDKASLKTLKENLVLIDKMLQSIGIITGISERMDVEYMKYAKEIFMNVTEDLLQERFDKKDLTDEQKELLRQDIRKQLDEANDINALNKWIQSMAESGDDILGITDRLIKNKLEEARIEAVDSYKELVDLAEAYYAETNERDTSFMYARNPDGSLNGRYVDEIDTEKFQQARSAFFKEVNAKYEKAFNETKDPNEIVEIEKRRSKEIKTWFKVNQEKIDDAEIEQIKKRKKDAIYAYYVIDPDNKVQKDAAEKVYQEWLSKNVAIIPETGSVYYMRNFVRPNKKIYASKQYAALTPAQKKFHAGYMKLYKEMKKDMPDHIYDSDKVIMMRKDGMERFLSSESKYKEFKNIMSETFMRKVDDTDRGMSQEDLSTEELLRQKALTDSTGRKMWTIPIRYVMELEDLSELSTDAVSAMSAFIGTSKRYEKMSEIVDTLELFGDILQERKMTQKDVLGRTTVTGKGGEAYAKYMKHVEMLVYGREKLDEGNILGTNIDQAKLVDAISSYTAMNNLAMNIYAATANIGLGNILMREEAFAKQYVDHADINFGIKEYSRQIGGYMNEIGKYKSTNKLKLLLEYTNALQDHDHTLMDMGWGKELHQRMMNRSHMYFLNHMGEHQMQSRMMLALMHNVKLKDANGKDITMYDAFEVSNNRITIKDGITYPDGTAFKASDMPAFNIKMRAINQRLHGIYNKEDRSAIQQHSLGRAAIMFRKWVVPGINRRFEKEYFNWSDMETREGMYRTSAKFLIGLIKEVKSSKELMMSAKGNWNKLTVEQRANILRTVTEASYFFLLLTAGTAMAMFAKGLDDDDELLKLFSNHTAHAILRIKSEIGFYKPIPPDDFLKLIQSPAASINTLEKISNIFKVIDYGFMLDDEKTFLRTYKSGRYKDDLYLSVWLRGVIPGYRTLSDYAYAEDKLKFLTE